jgi:hypothetical protein
MYRLQDNGAASAQKATELLFTAPFSSMYRLQDNGAASAQKATEPVVHRAIF